AESRQCKQYKIEPTCDTARHRKMRECHRVVSAKRLGCWLSSSTCDITRPSIRRGLFRCRADPRLLYQAETAYNSVQVIEVQQVPEDATAPDIKPLAGSRLMLLDQTGYIHSVWKPEPQITRSYWDLLACLPALTRPLEGPLGILGLGAGTLARMVHKYYPAQRMEGWELDPAVVMAGRMFMSGCQGRVGLGELESSGRLQVHTGDAFAPAASLPGPLFTSLAVDVFSGGRLPDTLLQPATWQAIKGRLRGEAGARVMVNLGQASGPTAAGLGQVEGSSLVSGAQATSLALQAMLQVFGEGQVSFTETRNLDDPSDRHSNCVAVTGCCEALATAWRPENLPAELAFLAQQYRWTPATKGEGPDEDTLAELSALFR
ncbi:hypothetical protein QJQ45_027563, partial [Haematococcus lacustris]